VKPLRNLPVRVLSVCSREKDFFGVWTRPHPPVHLHHGPSGFREDELVSSYLKDRKLPCLWYQMDEGDADLHILLLHGPCCSKGRTKVQEAAPLVDS